MKADLALPESDSLANDTLTKVYKVLGSDVIVLGSYWKLAAKSASTSECRTLPEKPSRQNRNRELNPNSST